MTQFITRAVIECVLTPVKTARFLWRWPALKARFPSIREPLGARQIIVTDNRHI